MALVNHAKREINAKIVFCGPSGAGKGTLLKSLCSKLPSEDRGVLRSMGVQQDRMLFFDFTHPEGGKPDLYRVRFHVYTLTGPVSHDQAWKLVLKGVDGVVFVADSDPARQPANRESFLQVRQALDSYDKGLEDVASVVLCNKRDLDEAVPLEQVQQGLAIARKSLVPVVATDGEGVLDGIAEVIRTILANLEGLGLDLQPGVSVLRELGRPGVASASATTVTVAGEQKQIQGVDEVPGQSDRAVALALAGSPEIALDGTLRIPISLDCCGSQQTLVLTVSLQR
jgi:signal recognition particle receptor subunit beta